MSYSNIENSNFLNIIHFKNKQTRFFLVLKSESCHGGNCGEFGRKWVQDLQRRPTSAAGIGLRNLPGFVGFVWLAFCLVPEQMICIQVPSADPNTISPSLSSFPHSKGKISCFVYFLLCLLILPPLESGLL